MRPSKRRSQSPQLRWKSSFSDAGERDHILSMPPKLKLLIHVVVMVLVAITLCVNVVILLLPQPEYRPPEVPPPPLPGYGGHPGQQYVIRTSSSTDAAIRHAKNWADIYLNPVGWYLRVVRGTTPGSLYILLDSDESWVTRIAWGRGLFLMTMLAVELYLLMRLAESRRPRVHGGQGGSAG